MEDCKFNDSEKDLYDRIDMPSNFGKYKFVYVTTEKLLSQRKFCKQKKGEGVSNFFSAIYKYYMM